MTIWFLLLKMKCLNPQRKRLYCISLIKPLFLLWYLFLWGKTGCACGSERGCMQKRRQRKTNHLHNIYMTCVRPLSRNMLENEQRHTACAHCRSVPLLPSLRTPVHQLSRQQPPPTSTHSESLTHMLLKIFSFSLLNTIKLIETEILGSAKPTVGTNIPCTKNLQFIKVSTSLTDCLLSCEYNRTLLVPHYTQE